MNIEPEPNSHKMIYLNISMLKHYLLDWKPPSYTIDYPVLWRNRVFAMESPPVDSDNPIQFVGAVEVLVVPFLLCYWYLFYAVFFLSFFLSLLFLLLLLLHTHSISIYLYIFFFQWLLHSQNDTLISLWYTHSSKTPNVPVTHLATLFL